MKKRGMKILALVLGGGVLLQLGGCANLLLQQVVGTIVGGILSAVIQGILTGTAEPA